MSSILLCRASVLSLVLLMLAPVSGAPGLRAAEDPVSAKLTGELPSVLADAGPDELVPVSIVLGDQLTGGRLRAHARGATDRAERRETLARALKEHAGRTQARVLAEIQAAESLGRARKIQPLWIGNVVAAELTPEEVYAVAAFPEVERVSWAPQRPVFLDEQMSRAPWPQDGLGSSETRDGVDNVECGVELMQAPRVWNELAITGEGAVVAVIDSGVCWYHSDIQNQIWVNPGEDLDGDGVVMDDDDMNGVDDDGNGYVDDLIGYDIENGDNDPNDNNSHGSHCAGTVAGDGTGGFQSGMAPDAKIMPVRVGLGTSDEPDVWEAMQYVAEHGAGAISMSLGWQHSWNPDRNTWRVSSENTIDLGTAMVVAAGNEGQGNEPDNVRTPGDVPRIISVAAVNCSDQIASFSSRGPVTWQDVDPWFDHPYPPGLTKPDVAGPGVSTQSHNICSGYSTKSGTSMATPHVAGAVALMLSSNPGLTHDDVKMILEDTAVDLGPAGKDNTYGSGRVDAYEAVLQSATSDGRMAIREQAVACSSSLRLTVADADLTGSGTVDIDVQSDTETQPEVVTLTETSATSGVFTATIPTDGGPPAQDGKIQVRQGDTITATYIDADDGEGGINVAKTDTALTDCVAPLIDDVAPDNITPSSARITWQTDESSNSLVRYGSVSPPAQEKSDFQQVTSHSISLSGLDECTIYKYEVESTDSLGNTSVDDNGGAYYTFETYGDFPGVGVIPCHQGQATLDQEAYACSDTVQVTVTDIDLNTDPLVQEAIQVLMTSTSEPGGEWITVQEFDGDNSRFQGSIQLAAGAAVPGDGLLARAPGDLISVSYYDQDDGQGGARTSADTAIADCTAPFIDNVLVTELSATRAVVEWTTDEPATSRVEYGPTAALGSIVEDLSLKTFHSMAISAFDACERIHFRIFSVDAHGDGRVADANGQPLEFNLSQVGGLVFHDNLETDLGWQLNGEWERAAPAGFGTGTGDPAGAWSGGMALGNDLTGQGSLPGDYEPDVQEMASTPAINAIGHQNLELVYRRKLGVQSTDTAKVAIQSGGVSSVWRNTGAVSDNEWIVVRHDISEFADNHPAVLLSFQLQSDGSGQSYGWNIDEVIVKDATQPDYLACGGCAGAPSFGGVASVTDADACAAGGLQLGWAGTPAWGTGGGGTYEVYRGTAPDFSPGPSSQVAAGLSGVTWTDAGAPVGTDSWYVVRARSNESCAGGEGLDDGNLVRLSGTETVTRPTPGSPGWTLMVDKVGAAHARLSWAAAADADHYVVRRSETRDFAGPLDLAAVQGTFFEDENALANAKLYLYLVVAANACGEETP